MSVVIVEAVTNLSVKTVEYDVELGAASSIFRMLLIHGGQAHQRGVWLAGVAESFQSLGGVS